MSSRRPDVTLTQLRYFVAAAEALSMTLAAQKLLVAQSAVSAAISQLETQVGAQLFIRQRSRGLTLTAPGQQLLGDTRALLLGLEETLDTVRGVDNQVRGSIRIGCFVTLAPFVLPAMLSAVRAAHPYLEVEVDELDAEGARDSLRRGAIELLIGYDFALGSEVRTRVLLESAPHVLVSTQHPLATRPQVFLRELSRESMILLDLPYSRDYFLAILASVGLQPQIRHRSMNFETVRALVAHQQGFSILNQEPRHGSTYDGLKVASLPIADDVPSIAVVLASLRGVRMSARARTVGDVAARVVPAVLRNVELVSGSLPP